jgi:hypothetical protein
MDSLTTGALCDYNNDWENLWFAYLNYYNYTTVEQTTTTTTVKLPISNSWANYHYYNSWANTTTTTPGPNKLLQHMGQLQPQKTHGPTSHYTTHGPTTILQLMVHYH